MPLLIEMYERHGGRIEGVMPETATDDDEPYAWDQSYADDSCCDC